MTQFPHNKDEKREHEPPQTFGETFKRYRKQRHLGLEDVATQLRISSRTIQNWEAGKSLPQSSTWKEAKALVQPLFNLSSEEIEDLTNLITKPISKGDNGLSPDDDPSTNSRQLERQQKNETYLRDQSSRYPPEDIPPKLQDDIERVRENIAWLQHVLDQLRSRWWSRFFLDQSRNIHLNQERMLKKVGDMWLGMLTRPLANIPPVISTDPHAVVSPFHNQVRELREPAQTLPTQSSILATFRSMQDSMLILGAPGAGKTTLLVRLLEGLLKDAQQSDNPIPVIFNLSSWSHRKGTFSVWLRDELQHKYGVPRRIGTKWIKTGMVLPLLDGLDEVPLTDRDSCITAINQHCLIYGFTPMAVCSRTQDYASLTAKLHLSGAIEIKTLIPDQVDMFFENIGQDFVHARAVLHEDPTWHEILNTPLMLNIFALAFKEPTDATSFTGMSIEQRRNQLFRVYVEKMLTRRGEERYSREHVLRWVTYLARTMTAHSQTTFLLETIQPSWLSRPMLRWIYCLGEGLAVTIIAGAGTGLVYGLRMVLPDAPHGGWLPTVISPQWMTSLGEHVGLPLSSWETVSALLIFNTIIGLMIGLAVGLFGGVFLLTSYRRNHPNQSKFTYLAWQSIYKSIYISVITGLTAGLIAGLIAGPVGGVLEGVVTGSAAGVAAQIGSRPGQIQSVETVGWSWVRAARGAAVVLITALTWLVLIRFVQLPVDRISYRSRERAMIYVLVLGAVSGFTSGKIESKDKPNQGIRRSARHALIAGIGMWILMSILGGVTYPSHHPLYLHIMAGIEFGTAAGVIAGLAIGGFVCLQHYILRYILYLHGDIPWKYVDFLDYMTSRIFMHRIGGGYIFIHRTLKEYFASSHTTEDT